MLEDTTSLTQLLLDWEPVGAAVESEGGSAGAAGIAGDELLAFLGELPPVFPVSSPVSASTEASGDADTKPPQLSRSSLCRRRQREEIKRLRHEVEELETQRAALRRCRDGKRVRRGSSVGGGEELKKAVVDVPRHKIAVWERIARHQQELRVKAECENAKLRGLIDEHSKLAQRIEKAIHHRSLEEQTEKALEQKREEAITEVKAHAAERWKSTAASPHWQRIFQILFHNESFWMKELERELIYFSTDASGRTIIEGVYSKVFPFDLAKTSEAAWRSYNTHRVMLADGYFAVTSAAENLVVAESQVSLDVSGKILLLHAGVLIHKIHEQPNRVVFVWESWSNPESEEKAPPQTETANTTVSAIRLAFDMCVTFEQLSPSGDDGDSEPATISRVYSVSRPSYHASIQDDPIRVSSEQIVQSYHESNRRFSRLLETYLLDDALGLDALTAAG